MIANYVFLCPLVASCLIGTSFSFSFVLYFPGMPADWYYASFEITAVTKSYGLAKICFTVFKYCFVL